MNDQQRTGGWRRPALLASKPFLLALALLSMCTIVLFFLEYGREKDRALQAVQGRVSERVNALDSTISSTAMNVNLMKRWTESYLEKDYSVLIH